MITPGSPLHNFFRNFEYLVLTFALPIAVLMESTQSRFTTDHNFWFVFIILLGDTIILQMKENFKSLRQLEIKNLEKAIVWYKAYTMVAMIQFFIGAVSSHPFSSITLYVLTFVLFAARYLLYKRTISGGLA